MRDIDSKLEVLYELLVDNIEVLQEELIARIFNPSRIANTNKFASLLECLGSPVFIEPLLVKISEWEEGDAWLGDYLYAATCLLEQSGSDIEFDAPPGLIGKLELWIFNYRGEYSWMAASLLKFYESEAVEEIQLRKLEERGDFFLAYVECIIGLLRYDKSKHIGLLEQIANDETRDEKLRQFAQERIQSLP